MAAPTYGKPVRNRRDDVVRTSKCGRVVITTRKYDAPVAATYYDVVVDGALITRDADTLADAKWEAWHVIDPDGAEAEENG